MTFLTVSGRLFRMWLIDVSGKPNTNKRFLLSSVLQTNINMWEKKLFPSLRAPPSKIWGDGIRNIAFWTMSCTQRFLRTYRRWHLAQRAARGIPAEDLVPMGRWGSNSPRQSGIFKSHGLWITGERPLRELLWPIGKIFQHHRIPGLHQLGDA